MRFEWDEATNRANQKKHGLSFEDARALFETDDHLEIFDRDHSDSEDRFLSIGRIRAGIITVVWTERDEDVIRIIGARRATKREAASFLQHMEKR